MQTGMKSMEISVSEEDFDPFSRADRGGGAPLAARGCGAEPGHEPTGRGTEEEAGADLEGEESGLGAQNQKELN